MTEPCAVCGSELDGKDPPAASNFGGQIYCFCCDACKEEFDQNPQRYARRAA